MVQILVICLAKSIKFATGNSTWCWLEAIIFNKN